MFGGETLKIFTMRFNKKITIWLVRSFCYKYMELLTCVFVTKWVKIALAHVFIFTACIIPLLNAFFLWLIDVNLKWLLNMSSLSDLQVILLKVPQSDAFGCRICRICTKHSWHCLQKWHKVQFLIFLLTLLFYPCCLVCEVRHFCWVAVVSADSNFFGVRFNILATVHMQF